MSADQAAQLETLTRVVFLIPRLENAEADGLFNDVITEIRKRYGGVTWSQEKHPVFRGWWIDPKTLIPMRGDNTLIFLDVPSSKPQGELVDYLGLKQRLQDGLRQKVIWMTVQKVERITAFDQPD